MRKKLIPCPKGTRRICDLFLSGYCDGSVDSYYDCEDKQRALKTDGSKNWEHGENIEK